jgi:hypothetical protein
VLSLPEGTSLPRLQWTLVAKTTAFFSVSFVGAPSAAPNTTLGFSQASNCFNQHQNPESTARCPLNDSAVVPDAGANLPYAMVSIAIDNSSRHESPLAADYATNIAVIADPTSSIPFEPCVPWPNPPKAFSGQCPSSTCGCNTVGCVTPSDACQNRGWASEARSSLGVRDGVLSRPLVWAPVFGGCVNPLLLCRQRCGCERCVQPCVRPCVRPCGSSAICKQRRDCKHCSWLCMSFAPS